MKHEKKKLIPYIKKKIIAFYQLSPINLSTLTGFRFPAIPRLKGHMLWGRFKQQLAEDGVFENLLETIKYANTHESGMCYYWVGHKCLLFISKPEHVQQLLIEHHNKINRQSAYKILKLLIGPNITVDPHDLWKLKKEIYSDWLYRPEILAQHESTTLTIISNYIEHLKQQQKPILLEEFFGKFTLEVLVKTVLLPHSQIPPHCLQKLLDYQNDNTHQLFEFKSIFKWLIPSFIRNFMFQGQENNPEQLKKQLQQKLHHILFRPFSADLCQHANFINDIYQKTMFENNSSGHTHLNNNKCPNKNKFSKNDKQNHDNKNLNHHKDLNCTETTKNNRQTINHCKKDNNPTNSNEEFLNYFENPNVFGDTNMLLLAGQETSIATFQFAMYLLASHPESEKKLIDELKKNLNPNALNFKTINELPYLEMVIKETLRLFPPVPFLPRDVSKHFTLGDIPLKKGDIVLFSAYATQRSPELWENPNDFIPERFDKKNKIANFTFFPFGGGSHMCIGQRFAWQELKLLLAALYLNFDIKLEYSSFDVSLKQGALKPKAPLYAKFSESSVSNLN